MERSHETLWLTASGSLTALAVGLLGVSAALGGSHGQGAFWISGLTVAAYVVTPLAIFCFVAAMRQWRMPLTGDRPKRHVSPGQNTKPPVTSTRSAASGAPAVNQEHSTLTRVSSEFPVQVHQAAQNVQTATDHTPMESELAAVSALPDPSQPAAGVQPEATPTLPGSPRTLQLKRRYVAVAALVAVVCGSLSALGAHLAQGGHPAAAKATPPRLQAPHTVSKIGICHDDQGGVFWALRMMSGVVLNLGVANTSEGATKWGLTAGATYNQQLATELLYGNQSNSKQDLGFTIQLVQPFSHKGDIWTITWRATAGGPPNDISVSVNLGRPDARLVYMPGDTTVKTPISPGKYRLYTAADSEVLDPSQPLQTLHPDAYAGPSSIVARFLVEIPGFSITVNAKSPTNGAWLPSLYALPGNTLPIEITVANVGNITAYGVTLESTLSGRLNYIPGSASVGSSVTAPGKPIPDGIIEPSYHYPGVSLGTLSPGQTVVVRFRVRVADNVADGLTLGGYAEVAASNVHYNWGALTVNVQ